jgi:hypothetical protein
MATIDAITIMPQADYASSLGVLGCKVNTDLAASWPKPADCENLCIRITTSTRTLHVLHVDQSASAYGISSYAWDVLTSGETSPAGEGALIAYEFVSTRECTHILHEDALPLSATISVGFLTRCLSDPNSWVAQNFRLFNFHDPQYQEGAEEECDLDLSIRQQPFCPS